MVTVSAACLADDVCIAVGSRPMTCGILGAFVGAFVGATVGATVDGIVGVYRFDKCVLDSE